MRAVPLVEARVPGALSASLDVVDLAGDLGGRAARSTLAMTALRGTLPSRAGTPRSRWRNCFAILFRPGPADQTLSTRSISVRPRWPRRQDLAICVWP